MTIGSCIFSYRELFRRGCEKGILPPRLKHPPLGTRKAEGLVLHPTFDLLDPVGFFDPQTRLFYDRSGVCLGRVSKSGKSRHPLANLVTITEGKRKDFLMDECRMKLAYFIPLKDRICLVIDRARNAVIGTIASLTGNNPAGL